MKNNTKVYYERSRLLLNIFLLFYLYIFFVLVIANLLPRSTFTYFLFLVFGISGICILTLKFSSHILINEEMFRLSIKIPFTLVLLRLKITEIAVAEEADIKCNTYSGRRDIKKTIPCYKSYIFNNGNCLKLTMTNGKVFIMSCSNTDSIISHINFIKGIDKKAGQQ